MANWTPEEIQKIWEKGTECPPNDPNVWRKDQCGAWMYRNYYGALSKDEPHTSFKWQIDHIKPDSKGGEDVLYQMLALFNGITTIAVRTIV